MVVMFVHSFYSTHQFKVPRNWSNHSEGIVFFAVYGLLRSGMHVH